MRFPSLRLLLSAASKTFLRFRLVLAAAFLTAVAAILLVENDDSELFTKLLVSAQLGIPLFFALAVYLEKTGAARLQRISLLLVGIAALAGYFITFPTWMSTVAWTRHTQFNIGLHLLVAFIPFARTGEVNAFWQYNKSLFLRFIEAVVYSAVLYIGLAIALLAIDKLLGIKVSGETYIRLWIVVVAVFNTWFFLGGVPSSLRSLEYVRDYPKGLKVFVQYILIPLVIIYLVILTVYLGKIVVTQVWPSGWIGYLVSTVSTVGILSLLLVHPIRDQIENKWIRSFSRWFYILLFPSIIMLMLAIWKRISQYGITEKRYFLAILAVWLAGIAIYFTFSRAKNIKAIPATLCLIAFATSFGPWGAYRVSEMSQVKRLENLLVTNEILVDGLVDPAVAPVPYEDRREISAALYYIVDTHGPEAVAPWFGAAYAKIDSILGETEARYRNVVAGVRSMMAHMGLEYVDRWAGKEEQFNYNADRQRETYPIAGYEIFVSFTWNSYAPDSVRIDERHVVAFDSGRNHLLLRRGAEPILELAIDPLFEKVRSHAAEGQNVYSLPPDVMHVEGRSDRAAMSVHVLHVSGQAKDGKREIRTLTANCFLRVE